MKSKSPSAEAIAGMAGRGEDVSQFFTNRGRMNEPVLSESAPLTPPMELRKQYPGYVPFHLGKLRGKQKMYGGVPPFAQTLVEFVSFPWRDPADGKVYIHARAIEDPGSMRRYECRKEISLVPWSWLRMQAYKEGFLAGRRYEGGHVYEATKTK